jgi:hypothetical protein
LFAPVSGVEPGLFTATGCFVVRSIDSNIGEVEPHDVVIGGECFNGERIKHAVGDPFVAAGTQRRV